MKTHKIKTYNFTELNETAQERALESLSDVNVDYDWFDSVYDDAKTIGLKITGFDVYHKGIDGDLTEDIAYTVDAILANHGENTSTYQLAKAYKHRIPAYNMMFDDDQEKNYYDTIEELTREFLPELLQEYLTILDKEFDYLTSKEAIIETIEANDYEFLADGKLY